MAFIDRLIDSHMVSLLIRPRFLHKRRKKVLNSPDASRVDEAIGVAGESFKIGVHRIRRASRDVTHNRAVLRRPAGSQKFKRNKKIM